MARSLYDVGDRNPDRDNSWLNDRQEKSARVVPVGMILAALVVAALGTMLIRTVLPSPASASAQEAPTMIADQFALCDDPKGQACVLTADSYAWRGHLYHLTGISVPSLTGARCPQEAVLARQSRATLAAMMNGGNFDARPDPADRDPDARLLMRDGVSLGTLMILKGQAREASAQPIDWCAA
jgi:hypothetical protein